ncbi:hypothetical protein O7622_09255 [Micromonospora sp. WMMD1076]|uniref:restriction endonuclease-related protein n=1 Tax=Micromonospora sp. WMMD1076 TaxID=3016103 RepID=UPI00249B6EDD|nr:hypothetical protein [Micromonospora sp. WMMD1076]WFF08715.1 hypothetical protein O7622_09255 [Micromonospora sp. WMMD1076]
MTGPVVGPPAPWEQVLAAVLRAAYAWSVRHTGAAAVKEVARMTGVLMAAHGPGVGPVTPGELAEALHRRLGLLPAIADCDDREISDAILLADDCLTDQAYDLACEYAGPLGAAIDKGSRLPSWTMMRAEQIQAAAREAMAESGRQQDYVASRRFLIEHPAATSRAELRELLSVAGVSLPPGGYQAIPAEQRHRARDGVDWWWPCPICRWPMAVTGDRVRCRYRPHTASYRIARTPWARSRSRPGVAPETGPRSRHRIRPVLTRTDPGPRVAMPAAQPAADAVCVETGIWRFVVVPGASELRLYRKLTRLGAAVELWPDLDAYDLLVTVGSMAYKIDLKEYRSTRRLLEKLRDARPDVEILLPDTHDRQLGVLQDALPRAVRVTTERRFVSRIRNQLKECR